MECGEKMQGKRFYLESLGADPFLRASADSVEKARTLFKPVEATKKTVNVMERKRDKKNAQKPRTWSTRL